MYMYMFMYISYSVCVALGQMRKAMLVQKFKELKASGRLEKYIERRRKKLEARERKRLSLRPPPRRE